MRARVTAAAVRAARKERDDQVRHRKKSQLKQASLRLTSATVVAAAATLGMVGVASAGENGDSTGPEQSGQHAVDGSGPYPSLVEGVVGGVGGALHGVLGDDVLRHIITGIL